MRKMPTTVDLMDFIAEVDDTVRFDSKQRAEDLRQQLRRLLSERGNLGLLLAKSKRYPAPVRRRLHTTLASVNIQVPALIRKP